MVGIVSLVFSFVLPAEQLSWCGWIYFAIAIMTRLFSILQKRRLAALADGR
jgi:hypothetical protein